MRCPRRPRPAANASPACSGHQAGPLPSETWVSHLRRQVALGNSRHVLCPRNGRDETQVRPLQLCEREQVSIWPVWASCPLAGVSLPTQSCYSKRSVLIPPS